MKIGVVKEIKDRENRVALSPNGAKELVRRGHSVMVEAGAGAGSGLDDEAYRRTGAVLVSAARGLGRDHRRAQVEAGGFHGHAALEIAKLLR